MFCKAALEAPMVLPFGYGEDVCFVANDWHSGLAPVMINKVYKPNGTSRRPRSVVARDEIFFSPLFSSRKKFSAAAPPGRILDERRPRFFFDRRRRSKTLRSDRARDLADRATSLTSLTSLTSR